jgi:hypothetical protein
MTEQDWVRATDPTKMLKFVYDMAYSERKLRLFRCACCRLVWHLLTDVRSQFVVEVAERFADGMACPGELLAADIGASRVARAINWLPSDRPRVRSHGTELPDHQAKVRDAVRRAAELAWAAGKGRLIYSPARVAWGDDGEARCKVVRDIFYPFRITRLAPAILSWSGGTIRALAEAVYEHRDMPSGHLDPARLAVLADALEEAGADEPILEHLRGLGPHWRGCHVLDALLGKQ